MIFTDWIRRITTGPTQNTKNIIVVRKMEGSLFGKINEETPKYTLLKKFETYEIRKYNPQIIAEVKGADRNSQFGILAGKKTSQVNKQGYIFGGNKLRTGNGSTKIAMTAPVVMEKANVKIAMTTPVTTSEFDTMSFTMPSQYKSIEELPIPNDSRVQLKQLDTTTKAVLMFSGLAYDVTVQAKGVELLEALKKDGIKAKGSPSLAQYNPPWTIPQMRTNEVHVEVELDENNSKI